MPENTTTIVGSTHRILNLFRKEAAEHNLALTEGAGDLEITTQYGQIVAVAEKDRVILALRAETEGNLLVIRDAVQGHLGSDQVLDWTGVQTGRPANLTVLHVASISQPSASFLRLRLTGDVAHLAHDGMHVRLIAPAATGEPWPTVTTTGRTIWPEQSPLPHRPVYTIAHLQDDAIDIDIFQHTSGRTQLWTQHLRRGDEVGVIGPGGSDVPKSKNLSLWGDETALPAMLRIIADASEDVRGQATFVVGDKGDIRSAPQDRFLLRWILRAGPCHMGELLKNERGVHKDAFLWFAGGSVETRMVRELIAEANRPKDNTYVATYWK